jgi:hypothetical protein
MPIQPPWIKVSQPGLESLMTYAEWMDTPPLMRLWMLAQSSMRGNGHAVFDRDALAIKLGSYGKDADGLPRSVIPLSARNINENADRLIDGGYLLERKTRRASPHNPAMICVVVPGDIAEAPYRLPGYSRPCPIHRDFKRSYRHIDARTGECDEWETEAA